MNLQRNAGVSVTEFQELVKRVKNLEKDKAKLKWQVEKLVEKNKKLVKEMQSAVRDGVSEQISGVRDVLDIHSNQIMGMKAWAQLEHDYESEGSDGDDEVDEYGTVADPLEGITKELKCPERSWRVRDVLEDVDWSNKGKEWHGTEHYRERSPTGSVDTDTREKELEDESDSAEVARILA